VENNILSTVMPNAVDTWAALNPERSSGKTFDSAVNKMLQHVERMRYDRIMLQSHTDKHGVMWIPSKAELIGTESITAGLIGPDTLWPSDHFGIYLECTVVNTK